MKKHNSTTLRCTGVFSAYVISIIMTDCALHICQSYWAIGESRLYSVLMSEYETQLAYLWHNRSFCWHMIEVQVHQIVWVTYHYDRLITAYLSIAFGIKTVQAILSPCVRIFMAKPQLLLAYGGSSGAPVNPGHMIVTDLSQHIGQSHLAIQTG